MNIIASIRGESFLIDVVTLSECNHQTVSQACIRTVTHVDIEFEKIIVFITDSAAYCKKANREVLSNIFNNSYHVLCLAHILNLVEVFSHWPAFDNVTQLTTFIKSAFFRKQSREKKKKKKKLYLKWLENYLPKEQMKLPPVPVATRWNSWFNAGRYHSSFIQFYEGFFKQEKSHGLAVDRILELEDSGRLHHASFLNLCLKLYFITENCTRLIKALTSLEKTKSPLACVVYYVMEDVKQYLHAGISKSIFGLETDRLLSELKPRERESYLRLSRFVQRIFF